MGYTLNFVIPQGPTGPTGASPSVAYGGKYSNTTQTINLAIGSQSRIALANNMPSANVTYVPTDCITINQAGTYEIDYSANLSAALATTLTMAVRANGTNIPSTVITRALSVGTTSVYSGSIIATLAAGDVLDMAISALIAVGITLGSGVNATLSVKKIN